MPNNSNYITKENLAKVEEVREIPTYQSKYTDEEVAKLKEIFIAEQKEAIKKYQIKTSPLSPEARSKVIKKYGGNYQSSRMDSEDIAIMQMYGPGFWDDFLKPVASVALVAASWFPPTAPIAMPISLTVAGIGATTMGIGHVTGNEKLKEVGKDIGQIAVGGIEEAAK